MSLKALMSQRKAAARLNHPYAKYDSSGRLSCSICGLAIKHDNLWAAHLVSKQHRVNAQKHEQSTTATVAGSKRKRDQDESDEATKKAKQQDDDDNALPNDFFDGPAPKRDQTTGIGETSGVQGEQEEDDPEWAAFEAELATPAAAEPGNGRGLKLPPVMGSTAGATISARPIEYEFGAPRIASNAEQAQDDEQEDEEEEETEEQRLERLEREEREEMLERINEEERAQQEADERVVALQQKMQRIKEMRQQRKSNKDKP